MTEGFEACPKPRHRTHEAVGQWLKPWKSLAHASNEDVDAPKIGLAFAFGAGPQIVTAVLLGRFAHRPQEQLRVIEQTFAASAAGVLILLEPTL